METNNNNGNYDYEKSIQRLDDILNAPDSKYDEKDEIPKRNDLTYTNGFYVKCNAIFVDIRGSSGLPLKYKNKTLARLYRAYISEIVAIMNNYEICREINIVGDCVSGIFEATKKEHSKKMIDVAAQINSIVQILNYKLCKKGKESIKIGMGISKGRALMIQAGYNGSGLKDVVWMGDVVNNASNLCGKGNKDGNEVIVISKDVYNDLDGVVNNEGNKYQSWFNNNLLDSSYTGNVINIAMKEWLNEKQEKSPCY